MRSIEQQRAEIRRLMEKVQRAVAQGQITFDPVLDARIKEQRRQAEQMVQDCVGRSGSYMNEID